MCKCLPPSAEKVPTKDTISTRSCKCWYKTSGGGSLSSFLLALAMRKCTKVKDPTAVKMQHDDAVSNKSWTTACRAGTTSVLGPNRTACACMGVVVEEMAMAFGAVALLAASLVLLALVEAIVCLLAMNKNATRMKRAIGATINNRIDGPLNLFLPSATNKGAIKEKIHKQDRTTGIWSFLTSGRISVAYIVY